jgi:hypothetical protein
MTGPSDSQDRGAADTSGRPPPNRIGRGWILVLVAGCGLLLYLLENPPRRSAHTTLGREALCACRAYCAAQIFFRREDWDSDGVLEYADDLSKLHSTVGKDGQAVQFLDEAFAVARGPAGLPKRGYLYMEMRTVAGRPVDWSSEFALCAAPAKYGRHTRFVLIMKTDERVWAKDLGSSEFVTDFPADPPGAGWRDAEDISSEEWEGGRGAEFWATLVTVVALVVAFLLRMAWWVFRALRPADTGAR